MKAWKNTVTLDGLIEDLLDPASESDAELAIIGGKPLDLTRFPKLRGIFKCGIGRDNIPQQEADRRGIAVRIASAETAHVIYEETANFACKLILDLAFQGAGNLADWTKVDRRALREQTLLVLGCGNIGQRVAAKMTAFMPVVTYDQMHNRPEELEPLVRRADYISLHVPLVPETRGWFDAEKIGWMKPGAGLVNTARGPIVDEEALHEAILAGRIRAAFDVFWEEPYHGKLRAFHPDRFLMSPHIASTCQAFLTGLRRDLASFIHELQQT